MILAPLALFACAVPVDITWPASGDEGDTAPPEACSDPFPELTLSSAELDLGTLDPAGTATASFEVSNTGDLSLAVTSIEVGDREIDDFTVGWTLASCASEGTADGGFPVLVLPPGCAQPVTVTYTALTPGEVQNAVVVRSEGVDDAAYAADPLHAQGVVYLRGESTERPSTAEGEAPYVVGDVITVSRTSLVTGEKVTFGVRVSSGTPVSYAWSTDDGDGAFDAPSAAAVEYTAPDVGAACRGRNESIYAVVTNEDGQDWVFGRVAVWGAGSPLETCLPACE